MHDHTSILQQLATLMNPVMCNLTSWHRQTLVQVQAQAQAHPFHPTLYQYT
jgi:hypothetical protein